MQAVAALRIWRRHVIVNVIYGTLQIVDDDVPIKLPKGECACTQLYFTSLLLWCFFCSSAHLTETKSEFYMSSVLAGHFTPKSAFCND